MDPSSPGREATPRRSERIAASREPTGPRRSSRIAASPRRELESVPGSIRGSRGSNRISRNERRSAAGHTRRASRRRGAGLARTRGASQSRNASGAAAQTHQDQTEAMSISSDDSTASPSPQRYIQDPFPVTLEEVRGLCRSPEPRLNTPPLFTIKNNKQLITVPAYPTTIKEAHDKGWDVAQENVWIDLEDPEHPVCAPPPPPYFSERVCPDFLVADDDTVYVNLNPDTGPSRSHFSVQGTARRARMLQLCVTPGWPWDKHEYSGAAPDFNQDIVEARRDFGIEAPRARSPSLTPLIRPYTTPQVEPIPYPNAPLRYDDNEDVVEAPLSPWRPSEIVFLDKDNGSQQERPDINAEYLQNLAREILLFPSQEQPDAPSQPPGSGHDETMSNTDEVSQYFQLASKWNSKSPSPMPPWMSPRPRQSSNSPDPTAVSNTSDPSSHFLRPPPTLGLNTASSSGGGLIGQGTINPALLSRPPTVGRAYEQPASPFGRVVLAPAPPSTQPEASSDPLQTDDLDGETLGEFRNLDVADAP